MFKAGPLGKQKLLSYWYISNYALLSKAKLALGFATRNPL